MPKIGSGFPLGGIDLAKLAGESKSDKTKSKSEENKFGEILNTAAALGAKGAKDLHGAKIEKAATDFEALLLQEMLKSMWSATQHDDVLSSGDEETYRDMLHQALAQNIAETHTIGVKDVLMKDMIKSEKSENKTAELSSQKLKDL